MSNLPSLTPDLLLSNMIGMVLCLAIMFACICRLNAKNATRMRLSLQQVMYVCFALWAAGTLRELWLGHIIGWHGAAAGLGIFAHLATSFRYWSVQESLLREARTRTDMPTGCTRPLWIDEGDEYAKTAKR